MEKVEAPAGGQQNYFINYIKGISCILVVFIHIRFPGEFGQLVVALARAGVVAFFVVSGYYLYRDDIVTIKNKLPGKIIRTAKLMAMSLGIYLIWECFIRMVGTGIDSVIYYLKKVFCISSFIWFTVFSYDPVVGPLWFLIALTGAYILFLVIFKCGKEPKWIWAAILLEAHIIIMALSNLNSWDISQRFFRNVWFYGFPCTLIGYALHKYKDRIISHTGKLLPCFGISMGMVLTLVERYLIGVLQIYNGTLIIVLCAFILAMKNPCKFQKNVLTTIGRDYSKDIYIFHWMVGEILDKVIRVCNLSQEWISWVLPILVFCITLAGAILLQKIKSQIKR